MNRGVALFPQAVVVLLGGTLLLSCAGDLPDAHSETLSSAQAPGNLSNSRAAGGGFATTGAPEAIPPGREPVSASSRGKSTTRDGSVTLGPGTHVIVLEPDASPSEVHAAEDLQSHIEACTGVAPAILTNPADAGLPMIVLGCGPHARSLGVDPDLEELGDQGYQLKTVAPHVVIAGTRAVGTLYGVHRFLEDVFGVRWYAPGVTKTPAVASVTLEPTDELITPAFLFRDTSYLWPGADDDFHVRQAENAGYADENSPTGLEYAHDGRCHTYFWFISPDEFFDTHPEYFSEIGGVRIRDETQLCLTNPDVLDIVTERMLQRMAERPNVQQHNFSQMDWYNYCECENCRLINEQYETTGGTQFWFVNKLAERTSQVYPDKQVSTLAYTYSEEPPAGMTMHPNVAIWLCHMYPSCDAHPVRTCPLNADYKRRAEQWAAITGHLYIWHYITNFAHYYVPFPNFRAMADDMRFYRDIGVEGIYLQGMSQAGGGGEFSLLRPYYGMKLLWNPDVDPVAVRRDFLRGYYGDAWRPIDDYIELLHDKVDDDDIHMHLYTNPGQGYLPDDIMARGAGYFRQAKRIVQDDPVLLDRVQVAEMPLMYAHIFPRNGYQVHRGWLEWLGSIASVREARAFLDRMEAHGFESIMEWYADSSILLLMDAMFNVPPVIRTIESPHLSVEVVPLLAGRALRIIHKPTGQCITAYNVEQQLYFPFAGGLEDRVGEMSGYFGWVEPAQVTQAGTDTITTTAITLDGYRLVRNLALDPLDPILYVRSTLTNPFDSEREVRLRNHLELDLGDLQATQVYFVNSIGWEVYQDMDEVIDGMREGIHYYRDDRPLGSWTFSGSKGLQLTQSFDPDEIDFTWLYAYPATLGEFEVELWANRATLQPGESVEINQSLEIRQIDL